MVVAVGVLDHAMGIELRIYPLYVVPVALLSWRTGLRAGLFMSLLATATWAGSNFLAGLSLPAWAWMFNGTAHLAAFAVVVSLVVFLQRSKAAERRLARVDPLTGLLNVRAFYEVASAEFERQRRYPHATTLAIIDLDNFKEVNDRFGHQTGDQALLLVATTFRAATRATDVLARLGGDEFALLLPETDLEGACQILQRVQTTVTQAMAANSWPVSCSVGAVTFDAPPARVDTVVSAADRLMYGVKETGKSAVRLDLFGPDARPQGSATAAGAMSPALLADCSCPTAAR